MAAITKIELWNDVGFIDGAVEIPSLAAPDPSDPDYVIEPEYPVNPSKDRYFSEFKLREFYEELMTVSYMRITYEFNVPAGPPRTQVFYGWVDSVSIGSDGDLPVTTISWHIDEWRTWKSSVTFGSGHVKRRPFVDIDSTPIQDYQYRFLKLDDTGIQTKEICPTYSLYEGSPPVRKATLWWVIFSFNENVTENNVTFTRITKGAIPIWIDKDLNGNGSLNDRGALRFKVGNTEAHGISLSGVLSGGLDEFLGISPNTINGVWLSPILFDPSVLSGTGDLGNPLIINYSTSIRVKSQGYPYGFVDITSVGRYPAKIHYTPGTIITYPGELRSTETDRYIITDFDGSKALDLPYGMLFTEWDIYNIIEADTAALVISFRDGFSGRTEGTVVTLPLPQLPVNSNANSEYVYSGQRDYDREARTVESNSSAWKSGASGGSTGALFGAVGAIGALAGTAAGAVPGLVNYGVEMLYQNDAEQALTDRLKARQSSSLILGSNAVTTAMKTKGPELKRLIPDQYSLDQISNIRGQFGISVDELLSSTDTLIRTTSPIGYYNIQNLIVSGDVPVSAKRWIRNKFASGVRLI